MDDFTGANQGEDSALEHDDHDYDTNADNDEKPKRVKR